MIISSDVQPAASSTPRLSVPIALAIAAAVAGAWIARRYAAEGLTLAHYDAKAHLVVARRIVDSITPGYQQIGAVWLPLPHLLNLPFVQYDPWFRTGASAVALSVAGFALSIFGASALVQRATGSRAASALASLYVGLNPNLLYLQSTPMTESLLLGVTLVAVWLSFEWVRSQTTTAREATGYPTRRSTAFRDSSVGIALALACLTRYEAWPIVAATLAAASFALWRGGHALTEAVRRTARLGAYPLAVTAGFLIHSRVTVGEWFVRDFFTPDNPARHDAVITTSQAWWGVNHLSGPTTTVAMTTGAIAVLAIGLVHRRRAAWLILVAPLAAVAVPWLAFFNGHPYRIRYMIPLVAAGAIPLAALAGLTARRLRPVAIAALAAIAMFDLHPLDATAPMLGEARWDVPNSVGRRQVIECLARGFKPGEKVMASMGSLAHFMQETASAGFVLNDYLHEGNGDIWLQALVSPRPYVEWILVQEYAEGGDMLAQFSRHKASFLDGFARQCEGGGVGLYKRVPGTGFRVPGSAVPGSGFRVPGTGVPRVPGAAGSWVRGFLVPRVPSSAGSAR